MKHKVMMIISLMLIFILTTSTIGYAGTSDLQKTNGEQIEFSEYEWAKVESKKTDKELLEEGYTKEDIELIRNYKSHFDTHIGKLTEMTDDALKSFGYEESDIEIIRNYKGTEAEIKGLGAKCTVTASTSNFKADGYTTGKLSYTWSWSKIPMSQAEDIIAAGWNGFAITSRSCTIKYYDMTTGAYLGATSATKLSPSSESGGIGGAGYKIDLVVPAENKFAKSGSGYYNVRSDVYGENVKKDFYYVVSYGHKVFLGEFGFSVGISGGECSITFKSALDEVATVRGSKIV